MKKLLSSVFGWLLIGAITTHAAPFTLAEFGVRMDATIGFPLRGDALSPAVNVTGFDTNTGLGTIAIQVRIPGPHSVSVLVDHEVDQTLNTFFNEFGARTGSPLPGQSWEIDEPGYRFGNLYTNFLANRLDGTNGVPSFAADDVAMALAWNFTLGPNQIALIQMRLSEAVPANGFYLSQTDPESQRTIHFSSTLEYSSGDTEPPSITCSSNIVATADPGSCSRSGVEFTTTATDNSPGVTVACTPASGSAFSVGVNPVRCVATDTAGNTNSCSFNVVIRPPPPVIQCPGNIIVECASPNGRTVSFNVTAASACDPNVAVGCVPSSGSVFHIGATAVNCVAVDTAGSRGECGFSVFLVSSTTNCTGEFSLLKETCLAGEVHAEPLLQPYPCGTCVEVTAVPADGWSFMGWLGDARGRNQTAQLTMTQNKCVEAVFGTPVSVGSAANGVAWLDPAASRYPCGSQVRALARPNPGYYLSHWTNALSGTANPQDFRVSGTNAVVTPVFLSLPAGQFALALEVRGFGTVRGQTGPVFNRYAAGSNVVLRAIPDSGQSFVGWSLAAAGTNSPAFVTNNLLTLEMNTSRALTAQFTPRPWIEIVRCQGELIKGLFRFKVHGQLLDTFVIEVSPDVCSQASWREVARETNVLGAVEYEDPYLPDVPQRFYRARLPNGD